jgi:hypothetical protein
VPNFRLAVGHRRSSAAATALSLSICKPLSGTSLACHVQMMPTPQQQRGAATMRPLWASPRPSDVVRSSACCPWSHIAVLVTLLLYSQHKQTNLASLPLSLLQRDPYMLLRDCPCPHCQAARQPFALHGPAFQFA